LASVGLLFVNHYKSIIKSIQKIEAKM